MSLESDYYLVNRPRQPKAETADYVEDKGILVPQRFRSMREALISSPGLRWCLRTISQPHS